MRKPKSNNKQYLRKEPCKKFDRWSVNTFGPDCDIFDSEEDIPKWEKNIGCMLSLCPTSWLEEFVPSGDSMENTSTKDESLSPEPQEDLKRTRLSVS